MVMFGNLLHTLHLKCFRQKDKSVMKNLAKKPLKNPLKKPLSSRKDSLSDMEKSDIDNHIIATAILIALPVILIGGGKLLDAWDEISAKNYLKTELMTKDEFAHAQERVHKKETTFSALRDSVVRIKEISKWCSLDSLKEAMATEDKKRAYEDSLYNAKEKAFWAHQDSMIQENKATDSLAANGIPFKKATTLMNATPSKTYSAVWDSVKAAKIKAQSYVPPVKTFRLYR